ncbi:hypothetical protein DFS33DRAFT_1380908 [Desarmillaria ectypa]|nr:hypothetical protein DFS33DRAFT_1380908 [Desarmillaria ectypa]
MATPGEFVLRIYMQPLFGLDLPTSTDWVRCLEIPTHRLREFTLMPYKWARHAASCIIGAEGDLSIDPNSTDFTGFDYDAPLHPYDLYYHIHGRIFPIDPDFENDSVSTQSELLSRSSRFRASIVRRDESCVITHADARYCEAAHIIGHSKGDQARGGGESITGIDDPRNGLLIDRDLHTDFGKAMAILQTPNFAMSTTDVVAGTTSDTNRWTFHCFAKAPLGLHIPMFQLVKHFAYPLLTGAVPGPLIQCLLPYTAQR